MNNPRPNMAWLLGIARRSMVDNGLQPDFDVAAIRRS